MKFMEQSNHIVGMGCWVKIDIKSFWVGIEYAQRLI
jgi:hypothetical protein